LFYLAIPVLCPFEGGFMKAAHFSIVWVAFILIQPGLSFGAENPLQATTENQHVSASSLEGSPENAVTQLDAVLDKVPGGQKLNG
jgi:hypothetical protein